MDPYHFQQRKEKERRIEQLEKALETDDVTQKDLQIKSELKRLRETMGGSNDDNSISSSRPSTANPISQKDIEMISWVKSIRTVLENKVGKMQKWMRRFDSNRDGKIDKEEFKNILKTYHIDADKDQTARLWSIFDPNNNGKISVSELVGAIDGCDKLHNIIRRQNSLKW
eukprot:CAMPEP_0184481418 /NCGR_PEP_ID=MMETSP0113_2-20130426/2962_1 /TAXON_ID=91329 /ORGANISM="Norrisiella sphaerica, Strain BC52" /LENGTH=169 /DNA_ID=CAMNT_0026860533 /DNA_START=84 /DNA_END=590 /DNA_ORIENTATION=-